MTLTPTSNSGLINPSPLIYDANPTGMFGDVDGDGMLTMHDAFMISTFCLGIANPTQAQLTLAEVDGTSMLSEHDAFEVVQMVLKKDQEFAGRITFNSKKFSFERNRFL